MNHLMKVSARRYQFLVKFRKNPFRGQNLPETSIIHSRLIELICASLDTKLGYLSTERFKIDFGTDFVFKSYLRFYSRFMIENIMLVLDKG